MKKICTENVRIWYVSLINQFSTNLIVFKDKNCFPEYTIIDSS
jgi:hypothetical protein